MSDKPFYRFRDGSFVEASSFEEAKRKKLEEVREEVEDEESWCSCTCVGFSHAYDCPLFTDDIPF